MERQFRCGPNWSITSCYRKWGRPKKFEATLADGLFFEVDNAVISSPQRSHCGDLLGLFMPGPCIDQGRTCMRPWSIALSLCQHAFSFAFCDNADCASGDGLIAQISARAVLQCDSLVDQRLPC